MPDETQDIENRIDAMLEELAEAIDRVAEPNAAVVARVKSAVRHELNEQWLAAYGTPTPSDETVGEVRQAVRRELIHTRALGRLFAAGPPRFWAGLAAAAMIALSVGLIRQVGYMASRPPALADRSTVQVAVDVDLFVEAAQLALAEDPFAESVLDELQSIDDTLVGSLRDREAQAVAEELDSAMRDILESTAPRDDTMGLNGKRPGVLG